MSSTFNNRDPVCTLIDEDVHATIAGITKAGGYHVDISSVEAPKRNYGNTAAHLKAVVHVGDDIPLDSPDDCPDGYKAWTRPYQIQVFLFDSENSNPFDYQRILNNVRADIARALMIDTTRGNNAQNTEVGGPLAFEDVNDATGIIVTVDVTYWTDERDATLNAPTAGA